MHIPLIQNPKLTKINYQIAIKFNPQKCKQENKNHYSTKTKTSSNICIKDPPSFIKKATLINSKYIQIMTMYIQRESERKKKKMKKKQKNNWPLRKDWKAKILETHREREGLILQEGLDEYLSFSPILSRRRNEKYVFIFLWFITSTTETCHAGYSHRMKGHL